MSYGLLPIHICIDNSVARRYNEIFLYKEIFQDKSIFWGFPLPLVLWLYVSPFMAISSYHYKQRLYEVKSGENCLLAEVNLFNQYFFALLPSNGVIFISSGLYATRLGVCSKQWPGVISKNYFETGRKIGYQAGVTGTFSE